MEYTKYLIAPFPLDQAPQIHGVIVDAFALMELPLNQSSKFFEYSYPTHVDEEGRKWILLKTLVGGAFVAKAFEIAEFFPDAKIACLGELVEVTPDYEPSEYGQTFSLHTHVMERVIDEEEFIAGFTPLNQMEE